MQAYQFVLYLHLLTVVGAVFVIGMMVTSLLRMRAAKTVAVARSEARFSSAAAKAMPVVAVLLLLTGGYLTQREWTWSTPWIDLAIAGLLLIMGVGGGVLGSRERRLDAALESAPGPDLDQTLVAQLRDPLLLVANGVIIGLVAGVMFVMTMKPALWIGIAALLVGAAAGAFIATPAARSKKAVETAGETA